MSAKNSKPKGKADEKSARSHKLASTEDVPKGHRRCSICGKVSELKDFETDPRTADKHGPRHVKCRSQRFKELRAKSGQKPAKNSEPKIASNQCTCNHLLGDHKGDDLKCGKCDCKKFARKSESKK